MPADRIRSVFKHDNLTHLAGGWFARRYINNILGGKDWFQSLTVLGLIVWIGAESAVRGVCSAEVVPVEWCTPMLKYVMGFGQILTILGVRRGGK
jgi:hypothetical protein